MLVGAALVVGGVLASPFILFFGALAAQAPNPYIPSGDPCCGTPDGWGEVASGVAFTTAVVFVFGLALALGVALLRWGIRGRPTRPSTVALRVPVGVAALALVAMGAALFLQRDRVHLAPDCGRFAFRQADWRSRDADAWQPMALGLADCAVLEHRTQAQVRAALGAPPYHRSYPRTKYGPATTVWGYRDVVFVRFTKGRVEAVTTDLFTD